SLLAVVLVVAGVAGWQWRSADTARKAAINAKQAAVSAKQIAISQRLAAQATALLPADPHVTHLLAILAHPPHPPPTPTPHPAPRPPPAHPRPPKRVAHTRTGTPPPPPTAPHPARVWHVPADSFRTLAGHAHEVLAVAYTPDGRHLATASG